MTNKITSKGVLSKGTWHMALLFEANEGKMKTNKKRVILWMTLFCGPDGTRTRDLRRDRAAF